MPNGDDPAPSRRRNLGPLLTGDRPMPHSQEAECAALSCLLQDAPSCYDTVAARLSDPKCFYNQAHQRIYRAVIEVGAQGNAEQVDLITVSQALEKQDRLEEVGGYDYLNRLLDVVPTTANVEMYVEAIIETYMLRQLIATGAEIVDKCYAQEDDLSSVIDFVEKEVMGITKVRTQRKVYHLPDLIPDAFDYLEALYKNEQSAKGIPSGFTDLDNKIMGLRSGELIVLAARPSIGKTTLAMNVARNVAVESGIPVGVFSLEMTALQVSVRLLCSEARISPKQLTEGNIQTTQWQGSIMPAADRLLRASIMIDDTPQLSDLEMRQKARRMYSENGVRFFVIDYLQLMKTTQGNSQTSREREVAVLSNEVKSLAKELDVPFMLLCQLNRQAEQPGAKPKLSHLRESGAIEQDADVVMLLHRDRESQIENDQIAREGQKSELIIAKNRNGETGIVPLTFFPQFTQFTNYTGIGEEDAV